MVSNSKSPRKTDTLPLDRLAELFPCILDLAGRVTASTLVQYRRDASYYLAYCGGDVERTRRSTSLHAWRQHMVEHSDLSPNTINRRIRPSANICVISQMRFP